MPFDDRTDAERLAAIEEAQKHVATKEWVQGIFHPIEKGQARIESALTDLAGQVRTLFSAHDKFLEEQAQQQREKREEERKINEEQLAALKERGFLAWINRVGTPALTFLSTLIGLLTVLAGGFLWWLSHAAR